MNRGLPSPGVGIAASNDPRLATRFNLLKSAHSPQFHSPLASSFRKYSPKLPTTSAPTPPPTPTPPTTNQTILFDASDNARPINISNVPMFNANNRSPPTKVIGLNSNASHVDPQNQQLPIKNSPDKVKSASKPDILTNSTSLSSTNSPKVIVSDTNFNNNTNINNSNNNNQININSNNTKNTISDLNTIQTTADTNKPDEQKKTDSPEKGSQSSRGPMLKMKSRPKKNDRISISNSQEQTTHSGSPNVSVLDSPPSLITLESPQKEPKISQSEPIKRTAPVVIKTDLLRQNELINQTDSSKAQLNATKTTPNNMVPAFFTWDAYLKLRPATVAPQEAFMQSLLPLQNKFLPKMKLEARDPRNSGCWSLASVISTEGLRLRLRLDGTDSMNDFFELIDSENIRRVNSKPEENLMAPINFKGNHANYLKFVDKLLSKDDIMVAPEECFVKCPKMPQKNLFKEGMKLEAIDRKHPHLICPATVGEVSGKQIKIVFDGWKGSFDYSCPYHSRDIFPINWCRDTHHYLAAPNGWDSLTNKKPEKTSKSLPSSTNPNQPSPIIRNRDKPLKRGRSKGSILNHIPTPKSFSRSSIKLPSLKDKHYTPSIKNKLDSTISPQKNQKCKTSVDDEISQDPAEKVNAGDTSNIDRFQCQRTVSYNEWKKSKSQLHVNESSENNDSFANLSDSTSMISDITQSDSIPLHFPPESDSKPNSPKRMKIGDESQASTRRGGLREIIIELSKQKPCLNWSVEDILKIISVDESLAKYTEVFENHEIDGKAFILLTSDIMIKHMGLKIGPVLKVIDLIEQVKRHK